MQCNIQLIHIIYILHNVSLQTKLTEYKYIHENTEHISLDIAEKLCADEDGYHLLSINSHEEQQLLEEYFNELANFYHRNTIFIFISLRKQLLVCLYSARK